MTQDKAAQRQKRKVLLIEPNYKNKYPPMSLMKIATYYRVYCHDEVKFFKGDLEDLVLGDIFDTLLKLLYENDNTIFWEKYQPDILSYLKKGNKTLLEKLASLTPSAIIKKVLLYYRSYYYHKEYFKAENRPYDIVCVTTLFTFYWDITIDTINFVKKLCKTTEGVKVGGVMASILADKVFSATGVQPIVGTLSESGSLGDNNAVIIDLLPLDYSILDEIDYSYPAKNAYFGYMTRGCVNKCAFCAVPKLEPVYKEYLPISAQIKKAAECFGSKKDLLLLDNNLLASNSFSKIIDEIKAAGFSRGATWSEPNLFEIAIKNLKSGYNDRAFIKCAVRQYKRLLSKAGESFQDIYNSLESKGLLKVHTAKKAAILETYDEMSPLFKDFYGKSKSLRCVDFNQGLDARLATDENMKKLFEIATSPLRIAFDHWELRDVYEKAIRCATRAGHKKLSNYILYNFKDTPLDLYRRLKLNVDLSEELGVSIYSFPMKYHPIEDERYFKKRDYLGEHWNRKFIRAVQAVLNSTKGKIGRGKAFFEEAFGRDEKEFMTILWMPETFIIYRRHFDKALREKLRDKYKTLDRDAKDLATEWRKKFYALSEEKRELAKSIIAKNDFSQSTVNSVPDKAIKEVLEYYTIKKPDKK